MAHRIIFFMSGFNGHRQGFILLRAFELEVDTRAYNPQGPCHLAIIDRTTGSTQRARQLLTIGLTLPT